jgi:hypothetical protein
MKSPPRVKARNNKDTNIPASTSSDLFTAKMTPTTLAQGEKGQETEFPSADEVRRALKAQTAPSKRIVRSICTDYSHSLCLVHSKRYVLYNSEYDSYQVYSLPNSQDILFRSCRSSSAIRCYQRLQSPAVIDNHIQSKHDTDVRRIQTSTFRSH